MLADEDSIAEELLREEAAELADLLLHAVGLVEGVDGGAKRAGILLIERR